MQRLLIASGPNAGTHYVLDGLATIGRSPDNTIVLDDPQVSRHHATIQAGANGPVVKDLGSGNGTFVNERRILEHVLHTGDFLRIGTVSVRYEKDDSTGGRPAEHGASQVSFDHSDAHGAKAYSTESVFNTLFTPATSVHADELKAAQDRLTAIYRANQIIAREHDLGKLFQRVLEQVFELVPASNGVIMLRDSGSGQLHVAYERSATPDAEIRVSTSIVKRADERGEAILVGDASADDRFSGSASIIRANIASAMCAPLVQQKERLGVIYVDTRGTPFAFTESDLQLLVALSAPAAIAIKNAQYVDQLEDDFETTLKLLANAIELRDHYTVGHTWRVTNFSLVIARELGWGDEKLREVEMGGILHDVGKIALSDAVLRKPGNLSDEEYDQMKIHPEKGASLMKDCRRLRELIPYCLYHHERWDGNGYPFGLAGEDIPIEGRVIAVADAFDAMTSNRPYRDGFDAAKAVAELEAHKGTQFDPACVDAFVRAFHRGEINDLLQAYHQHDEKSFACPFCSTYVQAPEDAGVGDVFSCGVCHRGIVLKRTGEAYHGELLTEAALKESLPESLRHHPANPGANTPSVDIPGAHTPSAGAVNPGPPNQTRRVG